MGWGGRELDVRAGVALLAVSVPCAVAVVRIETVGELMPFTTRKGGLAAIALILDPSFGLNATMTSFTARAWAFDRTRSLMRSAHSGPD
jgi:hypothetical protein